MQCFLFHLFFALLSCYFVSSLAFPTILCHIPLSNSILLSLCYFVLSYDIFHFCLIVLSHDTSCYLMLISHTILWFLLLSPIIKYYNVPSCACYKVLSCAIFCYQSYAFLCYLMLSHADIAYHPCFLQISSIMMCYLVLSHAIPWSSVSYHKLFD